MVRRLVVTLAATFSLFLAGQGSVTAASPETLGARLTTSTEWVEIESKASVPTHVVLRVAEGTFSLETTDFDMAPGETRRVPYTGTGEGSVAARMTALEASGDAGAVELVGWLRYTPQTPAPPTPPLIPIVGTTLLALAVLVIVVREVRRRRQTTALLYQAYRSRRL